MGIHSLLRRSRQRMERVLDRWAIDRFHRLWYHAPDTWAENRYLGFGIRQLPLDVWLYQELVYDLRPQFIVQTGILEGGSVLLFAHLLDLVGADPSCKVVGVDIEQTESARRLDHPRLHLIFADSMARQTLAEVEQVITPGPGLVVLDSDHAKDHVLAEMRAYAGLLEVGSFLVVEDTNINGRPVAADAGPGPGEAVDQFLRERSDFVQDDRWKRNLISFHQGGWLRRVR